MFNGTFKKEADISKRTLESIHLIFSSKTATELQLGGHNLFLKNASSGVSRCMGPMEIDISEERFASIFRV
jgi:hypothetical protein